MDFMGILGAAGLAGATGHRAFVPALLLGVAHHLGPMFPDSAGAPGFALSADWAWLASPIVMVVLGALLVLEYLAESNPDIPELSEWAMKAPKLIAGFIVVAAYVGQINDDGSTAAMISSGLLGSGVALGVDGMRSKVKQALDSSLGDATDGVSTKAVAIAETGWSLSVGVIAVVVPLAILLVAAITWFVWAGRRTIVKARMEPCHTCGADRHPQATACPHCRAAIG